MMELQADTAFSYTHLFVPCDSFTPKVLSELKEKFTIRSKYELPDGGRTTSILYKEAVSSSSGIRYFGLPRYHGLQLIAPVEDKTTLGFPIHFLMQDDQEHPMYAKQQKVLSVFRGSIENGSTGVVLVLPTGAGKTCLGIKFICHLGKTALVIVPKDDLVQQWINRIISLTDIKREEIGIIQQNRCEYKSKKIVIGMMHSLALRKKPYPKDMYSYFGVVVLDECIDENHYVFSSNGLCKLKDISVGDYILNEHREFVKVLNKRTVLKEAIKLKMQRGGDAFVVSADHPVVVRSDVQEHGRYREVYDYKVVSAEEATHLLFCVGEADCSKLKKDPEEYLVGMFYGDGHIYNNNGSCVLRFSYRKHKELRLKILQHLGCSHWAENCRGDLNITFSSDRTKSLIEKYELLSGKKSGIFTIHDSLFKKASPGVIRGLFDTDGWASTDGIRIALCSPVAIAQLKQMLAFHGIFSSSFVRKSKNLLHNDSHVLGIFGTHAVRFISLFGELPFVTKKVVKRSVIRDTYLYNNIMTTENVGIRRLVDIEVDSATHLFLCEGYVVHNCHRAASEKLGIVSSLFPAKYRIGLTATPKRTDGMEDVYRYTIGERWIGQVKDDMPKPTVLVKQYRIESGVLSSMRYIKNVINRRGRLNSLLAGCYERNKVLAAVILQSVKHNRQTVLMSDRTSQLDTIKHILLDNDISETEIGIYKGGVKDTDREKIITQKSIVLATYGAMDLGTDAPNLSLLVMGTPRSNVIQIVGRIRRIAENKKPPVVYDLVDTFPDCERMFQSRMKDYKLMSADTVYL